MTCCRKGSDTVYILACFLANISSLHVQKHFAKPEATITFHAVLMNLFEHGGRHPGAHFLHQPNSSCRP